MLKSVRAVSYNSWATLRNALWQVILESEFQRSVVGFQAVLFRSLHSLQ